MNNTPYRFCNSAKNISNLQLALEEVGLTFVSKSNSYKLEKWKLSCPWKQQDEITLNWNRTFCSDGISEGDDSVELVVNETSIGHINISRLRNQKLEKSLNTILMDEIQKIAMNYTRKRA